MLVVTAGAARAQGVAQAPASTQPLATVSGVVQKPETEKSVPVAGVMVTLHRVGTDSSGPVDSVRTDKAGHYAMRYRRFGSDDAVYFAAAIYRGIAYFSAPLKRVTVVGEEGEITVFDTTSRPVELHIQGHHFVVSAPHPDGVRDIVEVWELSNDTSATVVGKDSLTAVWSTPLPSGVTKVIGGPGDVGADAIVARSGKVLLVAPFGPGVKQLSYSYSLPSSAFPLTVVAPKSTSVMEVLVEEPGAQVVGKSLRSMDPAFTQGRTFKRFLAQDVPAGEKLRIDVPVTTATTLALVLAILAGVMALAMAGALGRALLGRGGRPMRPVTRLEDPVQSLVAAIADLDARHERNDPTLGADVYVSERAVLKARLAEELGRQA